MTLTDLTRFPINTRGYTVVPCIPLVYDNMHESLIGFKVTIGLGFFEDHGPTDSGTIAGYDEENIHIRVGSKVKKFEYDATSIQLQVYQFEKRILFSNQRVSDEELATSHKNFYNDHRKQQASVSPTPPPVKESDDVITPEPKKKPRRKVKTKKPTEQPKAQQPLKSDYVPKFGIQWS